MLSQLWGLLLLHPHNDYMPLPIHHLHPHHCSPLKIISIDYQILPVAQLLITYHRLPSGLEFSHTPLKVDLTLASNHHCGFWLRQFGYLLWFYYFRYFEGI